MDKKKIGIIVVGILVVIGIGIAVSSTISDSSPELVELEETEPTEPKHYSVELQESIAVTQQPWFLTLIAKVELVKLSKFHNVNTS